MLKLVKKEGIYMNEETKKITKSTNEKKTQPKKSGQTKKSTATTTKKTTTKKVTTKKETPKKTTSSKKNSKTTEVKPKKSVSPKKSEEVKAVKKEELKKSVEPEKVIDESIRTDMKKDQIIFALEVIATILATIIVLLVAVKTFRQMDFIKEDRMYKNNLYSESYLVNKGDSLKVSCDELDKAIMGEKSFIYVTNLGTKEEYKLEKKLDKIIKDYKLQDNFYLYELNDNCRSTALNSLQLTSDFKKVPMILFYRDGVLQEQIVRDDNEMLSDADLVKTLDIYEIKKGE